MNLNKDDVTTGIWTICFRKPGFADGPVMNAACDAFGDTVKDALIYAKEHVSHDILVSPHSPVTKIVYNGTINLFTQEIANCRITIYDEGLF